MEDVAAMRMGTLQSLASLNPENEPPPEILDAKGWAVQFMPDFAGRQYVLPSELEQVGKMYQQYVNSQIAMGELKRRGRNKPRAAQLLEDKLVETVWEQSGGDPEKAARRLAELGADKKLAGDPERDLTDSAIKSLLEKNPDPIAALSALTAAKSRGGTATDDPVKGMEAAAVKQAMEQNPMDALAARAAYAKSGRAEGEDKTSLIPTGNIAKQLGEPSGLGGETLLSRLRSDPVNAWNELYDMAETQGPALSPDQLAKLRELVAVSAPTPKQVTAWYEQQSGSLAGAMTPDALAVYQKTQDRLARVRGAAGKR